jgi:hypothetical protein
LNKLGFPTVDPDDASSPVLIPYNILPAATDLNKEKASFTKLVTDTCMSHFGPTHPLNLKIILLNLGSVVNAFLTMKKDLLSVTQKFMENEFEGYFNLINDQVRCEVGCEPVSKLHLPDCPSDMVRALVGGAAKSHAYILAAFRECDHNPLFSLMVRSSSFFVSPPPGMAICCLTLNSLFLLCYVRFSGLGHRWFASQPRGAVYARFFRYFSTTSHIT